MTFSSGMASINGGSDIGGKPALVGKVVEAVLLVRKCHPCSALLPPAFSLLLTLSNCFGINLHSPLSTCVRKANDNSYLSNALWTWQLCTLERLRVFCLTLGADLYSAVGVICETWFVHGMNSCIPLECQDWGKGGSSQSWQCQDFESA